MPSLTSLTLTELLDRFASSDPIPAGGSASALAGATGASLLVMASSLPRTKSGTLEEAAALAAAATQLLPIRDALRALVDRDAEAYAAVVAAARSTSGADAERRREGIAAAMRMATDVLLQTTRASAQALRIGVIVAENASRAAAGDVAAAAELLLAAVRGSGECAARNLAALKDPGYVEGVAAECREWAAETAADAERVRAAL
jgi:formiminotetrahydrofolate cyclodeaminase